MSIEFLSLPRIHESVAVYHEYIESLFDQRRYLEVIRCHLKFSEKNKPEWFLSPVGPFVPELEQLCLESYILDGKRKDQGIARAITYLESVLSRSFIDSIETHAGGPELLDGALVSAARSALSQIALFVSENTSECKQRLRFLLVAIHMHHANVSAWTSLLTGWLLTDADKFRLVRTVRWSGEEGRIAQHVESLLKADEELPNFNAGVVVDRYKLEIAFRRALVAPSMEQLVSLLNKVKQDLDSVSLMAPLACVALYTQGDSETLFSLSTRLLHESPEKADSFFVAGVYYLSIKRYDIARKFFSRAKGSVHGWIGYGLAFAMSDESGHAISAFRSATISFPKCVLPWIYAGMECIRTNELKLAQSFLISALGLCGPESPHNEVRFRSVVLNEIGLICLKAEQFDIAADNLKLCCDSSSHISKRSISIFHSNLGHALIKVRDVEGALKAFEMALGYNKQNGNALAGLGFCHHCKGNLSKAIDLYNASLYQISGNRKTENLVNNLIQIAVNEYSFSVRQSTIVPPIDEEAMVLSAF